MIKKIKCLTITLLFCLSLYSQSIGKNDSKEVPKVNRVIPLAVEQTGVPSEAFYRQDFEKIHDLKKEFHDTGNISDSVMSISDQDAFSGNKSLRNRYFPKDYYAKDEDPGSSGWVWQYFGDNKLGTSVPIPDTTPQTKIFARWYHKFEEGFTSQEERGTLPPKMARMRCFTKPWKTVYTVLFWIGGEKGYITIEQHTRAPNVEREWRPNYHTTFYLNTPENLGRWIHMELGVTLGEGHHSDRIQAWADGKLICDMANQDLAGGHRKETLNGMSWDCYWNGGSPRRQSRFYDDMILSKTPIGPARTGNNPVLEIAPSDKDYIYQVEVAQATQYPMSIDDPDRKHPKIEYMPVWSGKSENNRVEINSINGKFINTLTGKNQLDYNTLYAVRLRQRAGEGKWSEWHASFATQWKPGTDNQQKELPEGYLKGHHLKADKR